MNWTEEQKESFLEMQFEAQHSYYQEQFPNAQFDLILKDGVPIGRLYVDRRAEEIRLIDITLLPAFRGRGIGNELMASILEEAKNEMKPVRIHVEQNNPAMHLYRRLGFRQIDVNGIYHLLEWQA